jgi:hypothetical protein
MEAAIVVGASQNHADADRGLGPQEQRVEDGRGLRVGRFRDRECGGQDRDRGVANVGEMCVVVIERVRGGAVGERRGARRNSPVQTRDGRRLIAAFVGDEPTDDFGDRFVLAGKRDCEPVVERQTRHRAGGGGNGRGGNGGDVEEAVEGFEREHGSLRRRISAVRAPARRGSKG